MPSETKAKKVFSNTDMYDLTNPKVLKLPGELDEISGLAYYPKDTSVFAIIDEDAILFKIPLKDPRHLQTWIFGDKEDYEDLVLKENTFYVLVSKGDVKKLRFESGKLLVDEIQFPDGKKSKNEFESLIVDSISQKLQLICKNCLLDKKSRVTVYSVSDSTNAYDTAHVIKLNSLEEKLGADKFALRVSGSAVHPLTKDIYMVSSIEKLLVVYDSTYNLKSANFLDPEIYKQPEGITFTPEGDMIISNESAGKGPANLLLFKNKLK